MTNAFSDKELKESSIKIEKERFKISKIDFLVKSDRNDLASMDILLPVHVIHTKSNNPKEPVFWFAGGPGISNMSYKPPKRLLNNHDFVLVGYRGVDGSVKLKSKEIKKAVKGINKSLLSEESIKNMQNATSGYINSLKDKNIDQNNFTIIDVIDDFEEIRKKLGYKKINLLSASYGTRCALLYGYRYPLSINKSVMVGVNPPGHFVWWPVKTEQIIGKYDALFDSTNTSNLTINESIELAFKNMPKKWTVFKLDPEKIKATTFVLMYRKQSAVMVFDSYRKAATKGDYSGLYLMQLAYDYLVPKMFAWGDLFNKGASADFDKSLNYAELLEPDSFKIGAPLSALIWCGGLLWDNVSIDEEYRNVQYSEIYTLMIGGNLDISTPPEYATEKLLPKMPNANQVILKDMSHVDDIMGLQKDAFDSLISTYYLTGDVNTKMYKNDTINFKMPVSFNSIAKVLYPVVIIMSWFK
jgi:pimeloyl-ACP methyl ester carboxylesterase